MSSKKILTGDLKQSKEKFSNDVRKLAVAVGHIASDDIEKENISGDNVQEITTVDSEIIRAIQYVVKADETIAQAIQEVRFDDTAHIFKGINYDDVKEVIFSPRIGRYVILPTNRFKAKGIID